MDLLDAMRARHSVRRYTDRRLGKADAERLRAEIARCNREGGLHIRLVTDEPEAFRSFLARYGSFRNVSNYLILAGEDAADLETRAGYYGERLVLLAQTLGLNTCWVGLTYAKRKARLELDAGERLVCVIALGYGAEQGKAHPEHPPEERCSAPEDAPEWFRRGMEAVMLAPTAVNQQKFRFTYADGAVLAEATGGPFSKVDLGIAEYHFEIGAHGGVWKENRFTKAREEKSCGAVIRRRGRGEYLLVQHNAGHWSFPKGHMEAGESENDTALREIREETGLTVELDTGFRRTVTYYPKPGVVKDVVFFLAAPIGGTEHAQEEEIRKLAWLPYEVARPLVTFATDAEVLDAAEAYARKRK